MKKILILTGGTGGHVSPAIALYEEFKKIEYEVKIICDRRGLNYFNNICQKQDIKIIRSSPFNIALQKIFMCLFNNIVGFIQSIFYLLCYKPDIIISFGSYATFAPLLAAVILKKKFLLYEQNSVIGKVNLYFGKFAKKLFLSVPTLNKPDISNIELLPCPVRASIYEKRSSYPDMQDGFIISVVGGSQGAAILGYIIPEAIKNIDANLRQKIKIVYHQVIEQDVYRVSNYYMNNNISCVVSKFFDNIDEVFMKSHLIIARSGASTISEVCAIGRASILIPYPHASQNHQLYNAQLLQDNDATILIEQDKLNSEMLSKMITSFLENDKRVREIAENARNMYEHKLDLLVSKIKEEIG